MGLQRATALLVVACMLAGTLAGCISSKPEVTWEGRKIDEAIKEYGPPTRVSPNGDGMLYVWEFHHQTLTHPGLGGGVTTSGWVRMMTVNSGGVITSYTRVDQ